MSNKLIKTYETPTDFTICVYKSQKNGRFAVTTYDNVSEKHDDVKWYQNAEEAMSDAEYRSGQYDLNEGVKIKQTTRLNESHLRRIVTESLKKVLKEDYDGENEMWNAAREYLDCETMLDYIEYLLDNDGLLDEYAHKLDQAFDIMSTHQYFQNEK